MFQHTAARRRLPISLSMRSLTSEVSTHSRPKAAAQELYKVYSCSSFVSTHSRPKAAAAACLCRIAMGDCFNTQPPEGGCKLANWRTALLRGFNTQPPEGGCRQKTLFFCPNGQSFNTQPPEGGCYAEQHLNVTTIEVSTHSRPKAAAWYSHNKRQLLAGFNTQPPEGGCLAYDAAFKELYPFQHTAARRRLRFMADYGMQIFDVSTHSRPKAAAPYLKKQEKSAD